MGPPAKCNDYTFFLLPLRPRDFKAAARSKKPLLWALASILGVSLLSETQRSFAINHIPKANIWETSAERLVLLATSVPLAAYHLITT